MGLKEYEASKHLSLAAHQHDANAFYALLMATMREAGSNELDKLEGGFPEIIQELRKRYNAPGGVLPDDK